MDKEKFWYRREVGNPNKWDKFGELQLRYLISQGLQPRHYLLDVGCGPLRAGGHFIRYLEPGHYFGIDNNAPLLEAGRDVEVPELGLESRKPVLRVVSDFDMTWLPEEVSFDFVIAQSVLTHLSPRQIFECLLSIGGCMIAESRFYATFNPSPKGLQKKGKKHPRRDELEWTYYTFELLRELAEKANLRAMYIGEWGHDLNRKNEQMMVLFIKGI